LALDEQTLYIKHFLIFYSGKNQFFSINKKY
jgi:hypothetical protein